MVSFVTIADPFVKSEWVSEENVREARQKTDRSTDRLVDEIISLKSGNLISRCKTALAQIF